jgi:four helix bundle protein
MPKIEKFEDIGVWKIARELVNDVYKFTQTVPFSRDWGLKDQLQRASVSIMSNIAEGYERGSNKEFIRFLFIAKASAGEVRSLSYVAYDQKYLDEKVFSNLSSKASVISRQIKGFIVYLQKSNIKQR